MSSLVKANNYGWNYGISRYTEEEERMDDFSKIALDFKGKYGFYSTKIGVEWQVQVLTERTCSKGINNEC